MSTFLYFYSYDTFLYDTFLKLGSTKEKSKNLWLKILP